MEPELRLRTAVHESGHAVVAVLIGRAVNYVSVEPTLGSLGRTVLSHGHVLDLDDHRQVEREIALLVAGCVSEVIGAVATLPSGCTEEIWQAALLAVQIGNGRRGFERVVGRTARMLKAVWPAVLVLANELQRRQRLDGRAVRRLVKRELRLRRRWSLMRRCQ